ncbi:MAG: acyl-CoA synthetase [Burkholderiales bacterium]|nr:acyl-CoA synthetase [Burkholderiales bacterium]
MVALRIIVWVALHLGRTTARLLLHPICLYFLLFSIATRRASRAWLERVLERPVTWVDQFRHYHTFASTILDRVFLLNDRFDLFDLEVHGMEAMTEVCEARTGCFLVGAHFGSFEVTRAVGRMQPGLEVSLLMYEVNAPRIGAIIRAINPALGNKIIPLGALDSMLRVRERLDAGEFVGMLADRRLGDEESVTIPFFGVPAKFPAGPFRLAALLRRPIVLMFGIHRGGNRYEVHYERIAVDGDLTRLAMRYAQRLEHHARSAPYNWFNFHDFWQ